MNIPASRSPHAERQGRGREDTVFSYTNAILILVRSIPLPLCGACPFVGYCGFFSINYLRKKNNGEKRRLYRAYTALYDENRGNYSVHKYRVITSIVI